jgi:hypothetical protein
MREIKAVDGNIFVGCSEFYLVVPAVNFKRIWLKICRPAEISRFAVNIDHVDVLHFTVGENKRGELCKSISWLIFKTINRIPGITELVIFNGIDACQQFPGLVIEVETVKSPGFNLIQIKIIDQRLFFFFFPVSGSPGGV